MTDREYDLNAREFTEYLSAWLRGLPVLTIDQAFPDPARGAIVSIDVINGFCYEGALSSPRVANIVPPIVQLFEDAWEHGVRKIALAQDTHDPAAVEFGQWPVHCVRGSAESEAVPEIKALPFFDRITILPKNSINPAQQTGLSKWVEDLGPEVDHFVVVGDCTDLCTYQLAMYLRTDANARQIQRRIIVPENCSDTYDLSVGTALEIGAIPHPGDLLHALFLYHMMLNGVEIVRAIAR